MSLLHSTPLHPYEDRIIRMYNAVCQQYTGRYCYNSLRGAYTGLDGLVLGGRKMMRRTGKTLSGLDIEILVINGDKFIINIELEDL